jgi:hypothetical protein
LLGHSPILSRSMQSVKGLLLHLALSDLLVLLAVASCWASR